MFMALYDEVVASLHAIEQDTAVPPTRAEALQIAHIKALVIMAQAIEETGRGAGSTYL
jgi:hypothetical protein